jgi:hypothetical protein
MSSADAHTQVDQDSDPILGAAQIGPQHAAGARAATMAGWLTALAAADERRKQALRDAGPRPERDPAVAETTERLRADYRRILLERPAEAVAQGLDRHLWMRCVYSTIELYRRKVRKARDFLNQSAASTRGRAQDEAARDSLRRAAAGLASALDEASRFYEDLLAELQRLGGVPLRLRPPADRPAAAAPAAPGIRILGTASAARAAQPAQPPPPSAPDNGSGVASDFAAAGAQLEAVGGEEGSPGPPADAIRGLCASCLICLGDIERYRTSLTPGRPADEAACAAAEACYWQAQRLAPGLGNPHNQLAVLATYRSDSLRALAGYMRAILSPSPFLPTARDNLERLCRAQLGERPPPPPPRADPGADAWAAETAHLHAGFCRLHAALWIRPLTEDGQRLSVQAAHVLARMRALARAGQLDPQQLECLVIIAIGALCLPPYDADDGHAAGEAVAAGAGEGEAPVGTGGWDAPVNAAGGDAPRGVAGSRHPSLAEASPPQLALETLASMAIALLPCVQPTAELSTAPSSSAAALAPLLAALTPLLLWACAAPDALRQLAAPLRTQLFAALAQLGNALPQPTTNPPPAGAEPPTPPLTDAHVRWLGFSPIQPALAPLLQAARHGDALTGVLASDTGSLAVAHAAHIHSLLHRMAASNGNGEAGSRLYWHAARRVFSCEPESRGPSRGPQLTIPEGRETSMPVRAVPPPPRCDGAATPDYPGMSLDAHAAMEVERRPTPPNPDLLPPPRQLTGRGFPMPPPPPARPAAQADGRMGGLMTPSELGALTGVSDRATAHPAASFFPPADAADPSLFAPLAPADAAPGVRFLDHPFAPLTQHTNASAGWPAAADGAGAGSLFAGGPCLSAYFGAGVDSRFEVLLEEPSGADPDTVGGGSHMQGALARGMHGCGGDACAHEPRGAPSWEGAGAPGGSFAPATAGPPAGMDAQQMLAFVAGIQAETAAFGEAAAPPHDAIAPRAATPPGAISWYARGGAEPAHDPVGAPAAGSMWGASAADGLAPGAAPSLFGAWPSFSADWPWAPAPPQGAPNPRPWTGPPQAAPSIWGAPLS